MTQVINNLARTAPLVEDEEKVLAVLACEYRFHASVTASHYQVGWAGVKTQQMLFTW